VAQDVAWKSYWAMSNELSTPRVLICPSDKRKAATNWVEFNRQHLSYFVGLTAGAREPQAWLAGDRNLTTNGVPAGPGRVTLSTNTAWGWTAGMHNRSGNLVLGDGSVQQSTGGGGNRLAVEQRLLIP